MTERQPSSGNVHDLRVEAYHSRAPLYGEHVLTYRDPALALQLLETLDLRIPLRAVDLAAGQGDSSRHLAALGIRTVCVDRSPEMLARGIVRGTLDAAFAIIAALDRSLPFRDASFDLAICRYASHDIYDKRLLFLEVRRLLRDDARFQLIDMTTSYQHLLPFYNSLHAMKTIGPHIPCWIVGEGEYRALLTEAGFSVTHWDWYQSQVTTLDWLAEGQIDANRHAQICEFVRHTIRRSSLIGDAFHITEVPGGLKFTFPVLCATAVPSV